jgi:hypothetical protein
MSNAASNSMSLVRFFISPPLTFNGPERNPLTQRIRRLMNER